jgi:hypothetical protein
LKTVFTLGPSLSLSLSSHLLTMFTFHFTRCSPQELRRKAGVAITRPKATSVAVPVDAVTQLPPNNDNQRGSHIGNFARLPNSRIACCRCSKTRLLIYLQHSLVFLSSGTISAVIRVAALFRSCFASGPHFAASVL